MNPTVEEQNRRDAINVICAELAAGRSRPEQLTAGVIYDRLVAERIVAPVLDNDDTGTP